MHRHLIVRHVHPAWLGHSNPARRGYKRADRPHWHLWWQHEHDGQEVVRVRACRWCWRCLRPRRFTPRAWPPLDDVMRERTGWLADDNGHEARPSFFAEAWAENRVLLIPLLITWSVLLIAWLVTSG